MTLKERKAWQLASAAYGRATEEYYLVDELVNEICRGDKPNNSRARCSLLKRCTWVVQRFIMIEHLQDNYGLNSNEPLFKEAKKMLCKANELCSLLK